MTKVKTRIACEVGGFSAFRMKKFLTGVTGSDRGRSNNSLKAYFTRRFRFGFSFSVRNWV